MTEINPLIKDASPDNPSSGDQATDQAKAAPQSNIAIPDKYADNKLVLLPINAHTQHFYWDIGDEPLERQITNREVRLIVRLYYVNGGRRQEVESVHSTAARGNYYAYHTPNMQEMEAALFIQDGKGEREFLVSNRITTPSSGMHASPWEIWMTKNGKTHRLESRPSDLESAPEALTNPSSLDLIIRAESLRARLGDMAQNPSSSDSFGSDSHIKKN